jgi:phosphopantothenoylcysteine decarboxylase/phosphopantothenate--cysteine ligase
MNIILAVTGSIACYKSFDIARALIKSGHKVRVVLTQGALEFLRPETFRYLGVEKVYLPTDDFMPSELSKSETVLHIELAKWADKLIVAPLSANTLSRFAIGLTNDLLGSLFLALPKKPVILFPAMNTQMWNAQRTQEHMNKLKELKHVSVVSPISGLLACGDIGAGKFPEVAAVVDLIETISPLSKKEDKIVITAGATAAPIDPVRYLTNPSSGKMGIAIAKAFLAEGYRVVVLVGHNCVPEIENLLGHPQLELIRTPTTALMKEAALKHFPGAAAYISTGAIADIEFDAVTEKMKKESMTSGQLPYHQAADILKEILNVKKTGQKVVSFAAETETTQEVFMEKMRRKPVDLMIGNKVANGLIGGGPVEGFQRNEGTYYFVRSSEIQGPFNLTKDGLAQRLLAWYKGSVAW